MFHTLCTYIKICSYLYNRGHGELRLELTFISRIQVDLRYQLPDTYMYNPDSKVSDLGKGLLGGFFFFKKTHYVHGVPRGIWYASANRSGFKGAGRLIACPTRKER